MIIKSVGGSARVPLIIVQRRAKSSVNNSTIRAGLCRHVPYAANSLTVLVFPGQLLLHLQRLCAEKTREIPSHLT